MQVVVVEATLLFINLDDNGAVDMNGKMDNLEERIVNLEMVFAYLKNKKMLKRQENNPNKESPSSDDTADEDIAEFEVASKSKSSTSKPKKDSSSNYGVLGRYGVSVPALTKDHEGHKTNTPYPGKEIRHIQAIWE
ncbi:hypothetical protein Tco_0492592 [Tanacetum coccineum]